jgi:recombinational DNA repair ATPase RecF
LVKLDNAGDESHDAEETLEWYEQRITETGFSVDELKAKTIGELDTWLSEARGKMQQRRVEVVRKLQHQPRSTQVVAANEAHEPMPYGPEHEVRQQHTLQAEDSMQPLLTVV